MNRRSLLIGAASLLAAPAIVRASSLMPVVPLRPAIWRPRFTRVAYNGTHYWMEGSDDRTRWTAVSASVELFLDPTYNPPRPTLSARMDA